MRSTQHTVVRFTVEVGKGGVSIVDTLGGNRVGFMNYLETRQLIQDLIAACFQVSSSDERNEFLGKHPTIECGLSLPGALAPA